LFFVFCFLFLVFGVVQEEWVDVRWDNGDQNSYRYLGEHIDLEVVSGSVPSLPSIAFVPSVASVPSSTPSGGFELLKSGTRVRRGRDWKWGDQDGGSGNLGTVTKDQSPDVCSSFFIESNLFFS
jgi:hypothetical protein